MTDAKIIRACFRARLGRFALDAAFAVPAVGVTALFGPSGCGKTTVLRCLAGLERAEEGSCVVDGEVWQDETSFRPAHRRAVGYVFQEASLFPHLSVRGNLLYGAPTRRDGDARARVHFDEIIDLLGLDGLLDRSPRNLSGGERQRVAVGRALLSEPKLLLMDEPLSALDRQTKDEILPFLERLHDRLKLPVIYVSHDLGEVERLADHLVLMEEGRVRASGPLAELQSDPALPFATAREAAISFDAVIEALDPAFGLVTLKVDGGRFVIPAAAGTIGERRRLRIAAGDVSLARDPPGATTILNVLPAQIIAEAKVGPHEMLAVLGLGPEGKGARLLARVTRRSWEQLQLEIGLAVYAQVKGVALAR